MSVFEVKPQGYCAGVRQAIEKVLTYKKEHPSETVIVLGALVHNRHVSAMLENAGIVTLEANGKSRMELLDTVDAGTIVFTAHGVSPALRHKVQEKGLKSFDASCPFVLSTQKIIQARRDEGYTVFYIGKKGHPEAEASMLDEKVLLIEKEEDIPERIEGKIFVTNQTTMSILEIQALFDAILSRYPNAQIHDEICNATRVRQQAVLDLQGKGIDTLVVVGDPSSNNTRKLAATGKQAGIGRVLQIEEAGDLSSDDFSADEVIALTSGASTPGYLREEVLERLRQIQGEKKPSL